MLSIPGVVHLGEDGGEEEGEEAPFLFLRPGEKGFLGGGGVACSPPAGCSFCCFFLDHKPSGGFVLSAFCR